MNVSVVIPAYNAAETIADTLSSLCAQLFVNWEAIVVDDGSIDATAAVVESFVERDSRFRLIRQPQSGVSAARNAGVGHARHDWLLFLDADDWILPAHLERLTGVLAADPSLDGVHCGWARVASDGSLFNESYWPEAGDLFATFARTCAFAIHACVIRRALVDAAGGFDPALGIAEEWDLWQRIARMGARYGMVSDSLSRYRMRSGSASREGYRLLADGALVIRRGHGHDRRVSNPLPAHAGGIDAAGAPSALLYLACWSAGLLIGQGEDACSLFDLVRDERDPQLDPSIVANILFEALPLSLCQPPSNWPELWPAVEANIRRFLITLDAQAQTPGLFRRVSVVLERLVLEQANAHLPLTVGSTHGLHVEVTESISDVRLSETIDRLYCVVVMHGAPIGVVHLPVCDAVVSSDVIADVIAAEFAWPLLGRFFKSTVYRQIMVERTPDGAALWRGTTRLAEKVGAERPLAEQIHDAIGWPIFLQELWARPAWPHACFYDLTLAESTTEPRRVTCGWLVVEASEDLRDVEVDGPYLDVALLAGGTLVCAVSVPVSEGRVSAHVLRVALTQAGGMELCRVVVREALVGRPLASGETLRARLAAAAQLRHSTSELRLNLVSSDSPADRGLTASSGAVPGAAWVLKEALGADTPGWIFTRRSNAPVGTSVSRRAGLPSGAIHELEQAARIAGEMVVRIDCQTIGPERARYVPELSWHTFRMASQSAASAILAGPHYRPVSSRADFEARFAKAADPWAYSSAYEQTKYQQTLELLPDGHIARALEVGCAEGHFTLLLAEHVERLWAIDISQIALDRAARCCETLDNIQFARLDLRSDALIGQYQLIICSEVLYYLSDIAELQAVARRLVYALDPGGYLLTANANLVVDDPEAPGFDWDCPFGAKVIGETLAQTHGLRLVKELRTPLYRIQLFQRDSDAAGVAEVIEIEQPTAPPPAVAAHALWHGGAPVRAGEAAASEYSDHLPILMYHRVAPESSRRLARFCVTPRAFEEQLRYLRDAGYYSVSLEQWQRATDLKQPLPGRPIMLTFDDGYLDVFTYAWPLLKRYGFSATVFLVADYVGGVNGWDKAYGETIPLMGWDDARRLRDQGIIFGAHSTTHRPMTSLTIPDIAREGARARAILDRELGLPTTAFAYPYGDCDAVVQHLIGACGYVFGLTCRPGKSRFQDNLLALPRIEVTGFDRLQDLVAKLQ